MDFCFPSRTANRVRTKLLDFFFLRLRQCVSETWLVSNILNGGLLDGYTILRYDRDFHASGKLSGGAVKRNIPVDPVDSLYAGPYDSLIVHIIPRNCYHFRKAYASFLCFCPVSLVEEFFVTLSDVLLVKYPRVPFALWGDLLSLNDSRSSCSPYTQFSNDL